MGRSPSSKLPFLGLGPPPDSVQLNLYGPELESLDAIEALNEYARAIGAPWIAASVAWRHTRGRALPAQLEIAPNFDRASVLDVAAHALHVQAALDCPLLLANPRVIAKRGDLHHIDFMNALHEATGLGLALELRDFEDLDRLNADAIYALRIAGGDDALRIAEAIVPRARNLCAMSVDGESDPRLLRLVESAKHDGVDPPVPKINTFELDARRAHALFDRVHTEAGSERDLRLNAIAESLEREMPLSVALFGPQLLRFLASSELREKPLLDAFKTFVRRRLIEEHDEAKAGIVAAETVGRERFPRDLSELDAALAALRHRGLSREDLSEALAQIAQRVFAATH